MTNAEILSEISGDDVGPLYGLLRDCSKHVKQFRALQAAVEVGLFDALDTAKTADGLSSELGTHALVTATLCAVLEEMGLLRREQGGYANTETSARFLRSSSPLFQGEVIRNLQNGFVFWDRLADVLRDGPIKVDAADVFEDNMVHSLAAESLCGEVQKTIEIVLSKAPELLQARRLLDLGGGHGLYSIALTKRNPDLEAIVFDFGTLADDTARYIKRFRADNVRFVAGNLFTDDFGDGYDAVFLFYSPGGKSPAVLAKIRDCLKPGGIFVAKHAYYARGEGAKDNLLDLEWNLAEFAGVGKGAHVYQFTGDLCLEDYAASLEEHFSIVATAETADFGVPPLAKFGDRLDSMVIVARKRGDGRGGAP